MWGLLILHPDGAVVVAADGEGFGGGRKKNLHRYVRVRIVPFRGNALPALRLFLTLEQAPLILADALAFLGAKDLVVGVRAERLAAVKAFPGIFQPYCLCHEKSLLQFP